MIVVCSREQEKNVYLSVTKNHRIMENTKVSVWKGTLTAGIYLGLALVLYSLFLYFIGQTFNRTLGLVVYLIYIAGVFFGIKTFRDTYRNGFLTYGQALGAGTVTALYAGIIAAIFTYLLYAVIDPDLTAKLIEFSKQKMLDKGLSDEQVEMSMKASKIMMKPWIMAGSAIINSAFLGVIISLIEGIFLKREGETPFEEVSTDEA